MRPASVHLDLPMLRPLYIGLLPISPSLFSSSSFLWKEAWWRDTDLS